MLLGLGYELGRKGLLGWCCNRAAQPCARPATPTAPRLPAHQVTGLVVFEETDVPFKPEMTDATRIEQGAGGRVEVYR